MSRHKHDGSIHNDGANAPPSQPRPEAASGTGPVAAEAASGKEPVATPANETQPEPSSGVQAELSSTKADLFKARAELAELNDKYLRKLAEEVNFRKRMMREKEEALKYGVSGLLSDLIPVLDDFDRAIASAETARSYDTFHDGIVLIRRQLGQMLENRYYLKRVPAAGAAFDPNIHEAVAAEPADVPEAVVGEEFLPGYMLQDRVLRTAKVRVRLPSNPSNSSNNGGQPGAGASL